MNTDNSPISTSKHRGTLKVVLIDGLIVAAFAIRVRALGAKGLGYDEAATALMSRASIPEIVWFHWDAAFEHLPLWIILMHFWSRLVSQSESALRYAPALASVLTVPLVWALLKKVQPHDLQWRTLTAVLIALSPVLILYAQEARMYALVTLLGVASVFLLLEYLEKPDWRRAAGFVLVNWAMLGLQYYSLLLLVAEAVFVLAVYLVASRSAPIPGASAQRSPIWPALGIMAASVVPLGLWMAFAPGFQETLTVVLRESSKQPVSPLSFSAGLWQDLSFGAFRWQPRMATAGLLTIPVFLFGAVSAFVPLTGDVRPDTPYLSRWPLFFALIVLIPFGISALAFRSLAPRYILYVQPFIYAFAAFGIVRLWRLSRPAGAVAGVVMLGVALAGILYYFGPYEKSEYREMTRYLEQHYQPGEDAVLIEAPRQHLLAKYYLGQDFPLIPVPDVVLPDYWPITAPQIVPEEVDDLVQTHLRNYSVLWIIFSSEAEVDPGEFLAKYLTAVAYRQECQDWLDVRLCQFVSPSSVKSQLSLKIGEVFGEELELLHARLGLPDNAEPGREVPIRIELDWLARGRPSVDYKVSVKLISDEGGLVSQADHYPIGTLLPPTTWSAGDRKPGYLVVIIPAGLPKGAYAIQAVVYDPTSLIPVPHRSGNAPMSDDPLSLGVLEIGDTMRLRPAAVTENR